MANNIDNINEHSYFKFRAEVGLSCFCTTKTEVDKTKLNEGVRGGLMFFFFILSKLW